LLSGATKTLTNVGECADPKLRAQGVECQWGYELRSYDRARHLFVIEIYYYEGTDAMLVDDRTGRAHRFDGTVALSPKGNYIVEVLSDSYDRDVPSVRIWRRGRLDVVREWRGAPGHGDEELWLQSDDINYRVITWLSDREFELEVASGAAAKTFALRRISKGWRVRRLSR
jgi:hypothetical protein